MIFFTQYHRWKDAKYGWIKSWTVHVVSVAMENPNTVPPTMWMYMTIVERLNFSRVIYTSAVRGCWLQKLRSQDVWLRNEGLMKGGRRRIPDISWKQRLLNSMCCWTVCSTLSSRNPTNYLDEVSFTKTETWCFVRRVSSQKRIF